jgi:hypothetical protein
LRHGEDVAAEWESPEHLTDHYPDHRGELRVRSIAEYDASAQETIVLGVRFSYVDTPTRRRRIGYFHRDSSRFVVTTPEGRIVTHFRADEAYVAGLELSTYRDD